MSPPDRQSAPVTVAEWDTLASLYKEAEDALHETETIHGQLVIPSVNQLRYAGHHVMNMMTTANRDETEEELKKALRHCQRSIYDSYDSAICFLLKCIEEFKDDYRKIQITPHLPDYASILLKARDAQELLIKAHKVEEKRQDYYKECHVVAIELRTINDKLQQSREELNKAIDVENRNTMFGWAGLAVGLLAIIVAIIVAVGSQFHQP